MRSLVSTSAALMLLLSAAPAHAAVNFRWPWEPPQSTHEDRDEDRRNDRDRDRAPTRTDRTNRAPSQPPAHRNDGPDAQFVERMLANTAEQLELAELAEKRSGNPAVRALARRTLDEAGAFEQTLLQRAHELGLPAQPRRMNVSLPRGGWELDLAYLRATLDVIAYERPYFADYKGHVAGSFHDALARHWDDMVDRREEVKRLHDEVRNSARRHGNDV